MYNWHTPLMTVATNGEERKVQSRTSGFTSLHYTDLENNNKNGKKINLILMVDTYVCIYATLYFCISLHQFIIKNKTLAQ